MNWECVAPARPIADWKGALQGFGPQSTMYPADQRPSWTESRCRVALRGFPQPGGAGGWEKASSFPPSHARPAPQPLSPMALILPPPQFTPAPPADTPGCVIHLMLLFHFPAKAGSALTAASSYPTASAQVCGHPELTHGNPSAGQGWSWCYFFFGIFSFLINSENSRAGDQYLVSTPVLCPPIPVSPLTLKGGRGSVPGRHSPQALEQGPGLQPVWPGPHAGAVCPGPGCLVVTS